MMVIGLGNRFRQRARFPCLHGNGSFGRTSYYKRNVQTWTLPPRNYLIQVTARNADRFSEQPLGNAFYGQICSKLFHVHKFAKSEQIVKTKSSLSAIFVFHRKQAKFAL